MRRLLLLLAVVFSSSVALATQNPAPIRVAKMAVAAEQVGLTPDDLIAMLNSGMTTGQLLEYIIATTSGIEVKN